jgi:hypothetical protein
MKFRYIKDNTNWNIYFNVINHNLTTMGQIDIPIYLKRGYAKLLSFYPLTDKQEITFLNLTKKQKISYLFNYLIKILKQNNTKKSLILNLIKIKKDYDNIVHNKPSKDEYNDKMLIYSLSKKYDNILSLYLYKDKIKNSYTNLIKYTILSINILIDDKYIDIKKYQKIYNKNRNQDTTRGMTLRAKKGKSYFDLKMELNNLNDKRTEIEKYIENEVSRRINEKLNLQVKISNNKELNSVSNDIPTNADIGEQMGVNNF